MITGLQSQVKAVPTSTPSFTTVSTNFLQRRSACEKYSSMKKDEISKVPPIVQEVLRSSGRALDPATRIFMESRFGHDFSRVQVHTDTRAVESARAINALAYTVGDDIVFGAGYYSPSSSEGRGLLAHELIHVVQQHGLLSSPHRTPLLNHLDSDQYEQEANQMTGELAKGGTVSVRLQSSVPVIQRQAVPTGIKLAEAKPFGHTNLKNDELKKKWRTYIGSTTLMQVTPSRDYRKHCVKEYLSEVANTCPARFSELRTEGFCTESKCLDIGRWGTGGDPETGKMVTDGLDSFIDRHRTKHDKSLLEGSGKNECSVVCHQRYKFDRRYDLGSFFVIRNFRADKYTPPGSKDALHITTGEVQKVPAGLEAPSREKFAKEIAPGLKKSGVLTEAPSVPRGEKEE
jgi:hypothetical protein